MTQITFTDRELDVMSVLWRLGSGTVSEVRAELGEQHGYTTVLKILQILEDKGFASHTQEGRAYRYTPLIEPEQAGVSALGRILNKIYHGSVEHLVAQLVGERDLTAGDIRRLKRIVNQLEPSEGSGHDEEGGV